MPYDNNNLTEDTDAQHAERAHTMGNGIGDHGGGPTEEDLRIAEEAAEEFRRAREEIEREVSKLEEGLSIIIGREGLEIEV